MRFARINGGDGVELHASPDGERWVRLDGVPAGVRIAELASPAGRAEFVEPRLSGASTAAGVELDRAATIMDGGDIWGAGLNYVTHADDLGAAQPSSGPGSYLRPDGCLVDNAGDIELPEQSDRVTAEDAMSGWADTTDGRFALVSSPGGHSDVLASPEFLDRVAALITPEQGERRMS